MHVLLLIFLVVAAVLFALTAFGVQVRRLNLLGLGLFFWVLVSLFQMAAKL